jgi:hypothetical protein
MCGKKIGDDPGLERERERGGGGAWAGLGRNKRVGPNKNSKFFDLFKIISNRSDLIQLKDGLLELQKSQIKYLFDRFEIKNNFSYRYFLRFKTEFE